MKKLFLLLTLLLLLPLSVKAEESIKITKVELVNKTASTIVVEEPTFSLKKVNFNLKFSEVGDYAKYKITIKNESATDYEISNETKFLDNEYIKYEFSYDDSSILKANDEKVMYITLSYNKKVPEANFTEGKYTFVNNMEIELVNNYMIVNVPKTYKGYSVIMTILGIISIAASVILLMKIKNKKIKTSLIIVLLMLPMVVQALQKISIEIDTKIEIEKGIKKVYAINTNCIAKGSSLEAIGTTYSSCAATGRNVCLKYTIEDNKITATETCFVKDDEEHCLLGGVDECLFDENQGCTFTDTQPVYTNNIALANSAFTESKCYGDVYNSNCYNYGFAAAFGTSGQVRIYDNLWECNIEPGGNACCGEHTPEI